MLQYTVWQCSFLGKRSTELLSSLNSNILGSITPLEIPDTALSQTELLSWELMATLPLDVMSIDE
jgi:hypothetical protein